MLSILMVVLAGAPHAPSNLHADSGVFAASHAVGVCYRMALRDTLLAGRSAKPVLMVAIPAFDPEYAVYCEADLDGRPSVVSRTRRANMWASAFASAVKGDRHLDRKATCDRFRSVRQDTTESRAPIDRPLFEKLTAVWRQALQTITPPTSIESVRDGVQYYFGRCGEVGCLSGIAESPREGNRLRLLADLANLLVQYSKAPPSKRAEFSEALNREADRVLAAFPPEQAPDTQ